MKKSIKWIVSTGLLFLSTCAFSQGYRLQIEPQLPIPVLIVPDNVGNNQNYAYQGNNYDRRHDNNGYRQDYYEGEHHHRRHDNDGYRHDYYKGEHHRRHDNDGYRRDYYEGKHHRRHDNDEYRHHSRHDD